jgi:hypothetical protein
VRYIVQTVTGYRKPSTHGSPGLSASVHDSLVCYRTVGLFASEECVPGFGGSTPPRYYGHDGALAAAQALAARLNARKCDAA